jgi:hypothetical protein
MKFLRTKLFRVCLLLTLFSGLPFGMVKVLTARADPSSANSIYLPIIPNNYQNPPPVTISHYISWGQSDLTYQKFYDMGKTLGLSVPSGFWGYVVLNFGEPWMEGSTYKVLDYAYVSIPVTDVENYVKGYISGFYNNSPANAFLIATPSITNYGPYFSFSSDSQGFGRAWGTMITNIVTWINTPPSYAGKVAVAGGLDNELSWNIASKSLSWKSGYTSTASRPYLYFGDCNSCPYYDEPDWTPAPFGWTLEQVYSMASTTNGRALPQIYRKDRQNSEQWYNLSLYMYLHGYEPIGFMGAFTQSSACSEIGGCSSGNPDAIDNTPREGWEQLWSRISSDPRTAQTLNGIPFKLPVSADISWDHWKVSYIP